MIKASTEHPFLVAAYRLLVAAVALTPLFIRELRRSAQPFGWREVGWIALPAMALAVHFMTWVVGARQTNVASASLIANLTPAAMPFFLMAFYREKVNRLESTGTLFTLGGLLVLGASAFSFSKAELWGDVLCFISMLGFACYLALGRKNGSRLSLWLYMVPLYYLAGSLCLLSALPFINPIKSYTITNLALMLGLGLVPTVLGHTLLNYSLKHFRGQVVSVTNLGQVLFASVLGYLFFAENPAPIFYLAATLILMGVLIVLYSGYSQRVEPTPASS